MLLVMAIEGVDMSNKKCFLLSWLHKKSQEFRTKRQVTATTSETLS